MNKDQEVVDSNHCSRQAAPTLTGTSVSSDVDRRKFLLNILKHSGRVTLATGFIYTVSLITNKNGIAAGAK